MKEKVERLDDTGRGICYVDGKVTFVPKTVVGDIINLNITKTKKNYNEAIMTELITPSASRVNPLCPYFNICGGCDLQNISYEDTLEYKKNKVINLFKRNGITVNPTLIKNPNPYNYRNKITLKVIDGEIGFYEARSHNIIKIKECFIARPEINKIIPLINNWPLKNGEVTIRCNQNEEILIIVKTKENININVDEIKNVVKLVGIVVNEKTYYGENYLFEVINGIVYRISYNSFFQVNLLVASKIFEIITNNVNENDTILDLYCGVGTLGLSAAKKAKRVVGVEIIANAVLNAIYNARINKIENAEFVLNDATDAALKIKEKFNKIIVDPPRSGLSKEVINMLLAEEPESIIYVSCDMQTLVRDIKLLNEKYEIEKLYTLDMFSYTYHVENIVVLKRR